MFFFLRALSRYRVFVITGRVGYIYCLVADAPLFPCCIGIACNVVDIEMEILHIYGISFV